MKMATTKTRCFGPGFFVFDGWKNIPGCAALIQSCFRIGKVAVKRFLQVGNSFILRQPVGGDVELDAAGDEYATLFINGVI